MLDTGEGVRDLVGGCERVAGLPLGGSVTLAERELEPLLS